MPLLPDLRTLLLYYFKILKINELLIFKRHYRYHESNFKLLIFESSILKIDLFGFES